MATIYHPILDVLAQVDASSIAWWLARGWELQDLGDDDPADLPPLASHIARVAGAHPATAISYAGSAGLLATTVEAALDELDGEKVNQLPVTVTPAQIQIALDAAATAGGGTVRLPSGSWTLTSALELGDNVTLEGTGYGTQLRLGSGANCDVVTNADWEGGNTNIVIRNLRLNGNRTQQTETVGVGPGQSCVSLVNCTYSVVDTVWTESPFLHGVDFAVRDIEGNSYDDPGCVQCTATKVFATDFGDDGITTHYSHHITISDCHAWAAAASFSVSSNGVEVDDGSSYISVVNTSATNCVAGVMVQSHEDRTPARDVVILGGTSEACTRGVWILAGSTGAGGNRVSIIGRRIIDCTTDSIRIGDYRDVDIIGVHAINSGRFLTGTGTSATKMQRIRLTDCVQDGGTTLGLTSGVLGTCGPIELNNFTVCNLTGQANAVVIGQANVTVRGGRVEENTITGGGAAVLVLSPADNVRLLGLAIRNNVGSSGLELRTVSDVVVHGCHIEGHTAGNGQIYLAPSVTNSRVVIANNLVLGGFRGLRIQSSGGSGYITGNIFNGQSIAAIEDTSSGGTWTKANNIGVDL